ncbi:MAG: vitamin K epoxide reductase family protein [Candidatus Saccharibacteria bacterium]
METEPYKPGRPISLLLLALSLTGLIDASYLVYKHYFHVPLVCPIFGGCDRVLNSQYAQVFGVPLAVIGVAYYFAVTVFMLWYLRAGKVRLAQIATSLVAVAFLISLGLVYLQLFVLKSICAYCMFSALTTTALFAASLPILAKSK